MVSAMCVMGLEVSWNNRMEPVLWGTDCAGCRSHHQSSPRRKWRPTGPSCRSSSATAVLQSPTSRCRSSSLPAGAQFTHPAHLGPWPANICGRQTLAKFKPDPPNPEQQKVVDNVRPTVAAASPAVLELPHLNPLIQVRNYLKMFLILCDETREKPTVTLATRQSLIENNRQ